MHLGPCCFVCVVLFGFSWSSDVVTSGLYADPSKAGNEFLLMKSDWFLKDISPAQLSDEEGYKMTGVFFFFLKKYFISFLKFYLK